MSDPLPHPARASWNDGVATPRFRDLHERRLGDERMDDPNIDSELLVTALKGIRRINVASAAAGGIWPTLQKCAQRKPIRVLDLACGSGDVALALARKARSANTPVTIEGCDLSPVAVSLANETAERNGADVRFFEYDALRGDLPHGYDVIYSSLFLHHLSTPDVKSLLGRLAGAAPMIVANDLIRCRAGLLLAYAACYTLTRSPVVRFDGPHSVAAAFTIPEIRGIANEAGLHGHAIEWKWPFRFQLTYTNGGEA